MALLDRFRRRAASVAHARGPRMDADSERHLREFAQSRRGVEGFVEPQTTVTPVTLLLVAQDGEWTRRAVPSASWAHDFANGLSVPSYDAAVVGVPARMREYNRRQKRPAIEDDPGDLMS